jgi:hypothetical protein
MESVLDQILETWRTNNRINLLLIDRISDEGMKCTLSKRGGRDDRMSGLLVRLPGTDRRCSASVREIAPVFGCGAEHRGRRRIDAREELPEIGMLDRPERKREAPGDVTAQAEHTSSRQLETHQDLGDRVAEEQTTTAAGGPHPQPLSREWERGWG